MEEPITAMEFQRKLRDDKFFNDGKLALAREFVDALGIDEVIKLSGFSKDELLGK